MLYWWFGAGGAEKVSGGVAHYVFYGTKISAATLLSNSTCIALMSATRRSLYGINKMFIGYIDAKVINY